MSCSSAVAGQASVAGDSGFLPKQPRRQEQNRFEKRQECFKDNEAEAEGQREQPNQREEHYGENGHGPTQHEQQTPEHEYQQRLHGELLLIAMLSLVNSGLVQ